MFKCKIFVVDIFTMYTKHWYQCMYNLILKLIYFIFPFLNIIW